jgi:hypothetical protein
MRNRAKHNPAGGTNIGYFIMLQSGLKRVAKESIETVLLPGEHILWIKQRETNYLRFLLFMTCGIGGIMVAIAAFFWYVPNWTGTFYFLDTGIVIPAVVVYSAILACFYVPILLTVYNATTSIRKTLQKSGITLANLKHYHEIFALTNQRWIRRALQLPGTRGSSQYSPSISTPQEDLEGLALDTCQHAVVRKVVRGYQVSFFAQNVIEESLARPMTVRLTRPEADALLVHLRQLLTVINQTDKGGSASFPML